jgi:hypothetical protein
MRRWAIIAAGSIAILAIMYLFLLPMVNPPVSTGAQWVSAHLTLPTVNVATLDQPEQQPVHFAVRPAAEATFDIIELDSVRRC